MLRNRHLQVKMVKDNDVTSDAKAVLDIDFDKINQIMKEQVRYVALAVIGVYAAKSAIRTASDVTLIAAQTKLYK